MNKTYNWLQKCLLCSFLIFGSTPAFAQITPDNTLGAARSRLTPNVTIAGENGDRIDGGATRGSNLFHSFSDFNINDGQRVYFGNPAGIQNILTRVTGGNASNILGTLGVDGGANLFLINPNGIIFGQNARLDLRGSFVGTTANAIGFGEQGNFSATNPSAPPLLTVQPSALLFTQLNGGAIANQGLLTAPLGQSLVLAGGDIDFNSGLMGVQGGRIELAAIAGTGTVGLNADNSLSIPPDLPRADIALSNSEIGVTAGNNSGVAIHARNLDISGNSFIYSQIGSDAEAVDPIAGDITLDATDTMQIKEGSAIANGIAEGESGKGGNINVTTGSLSLSDGAFLQTSTYGTGDAGSVLVQAKDSVSASYSDIRSIVQSGAKGNGGNVNITAPTLSLTDGATLGTFVRQASNNLPAGFGIAGNVEVNVSGDVTISGGKDRFPSGIYSDLGEGAKGKGGSINITAGSLSVTDGARMNASTFGEGDAGSVLVQASDFVSVASSSFILSYVETGAKGKGGNINITAGSLSVTDGAQVNASTFGEGDAGNIQINATNSVSVSGTNSSSGFSSALFTSTTTDSTGIGGNIAVNTNVLRVSDGAVLNAGTQNNSNGGNITVNARQVEAINGGQFLTSTNGSGNAGKITLNATEQVIVNGSDPTFNDRVAKFEFGNSRLLQKLSLLSE